MIRAAGDLGAFCTSLAVLIGPFTTAAASFQTQRSCSLNLVSPEPRAVLTQHRLDGSKVRSVWRFSWSTCPGATRYHLYVIGPGALNPIVNIDTLKATVHEYWSTHYGITSRQGWSWKVRAHVDGRWSEWSETRSFDVSAILPPVQ